MSGINLYNDQPGTDTAVPNVFIDEYMTRANGEYVKIYLYMLRCTGQHMSQFSLSKAADHFDCTEKDIIRALKYWEKLRLFGLEYDDRGDLCGIRFLTDALTAAPCAKEEMPNASECFIKSAAAAKEGYSRDKINALKDREDVREMLFITEQYLGRTLNQNDLNTIFYWYDEMDIPADLIEFIIESCVSKGHTSLHYMQRVAEDYHAKNIRCVEDARSLMNRDAGVYRAVMKAFGIRGRNLVPAEMNFLKSWSQTMGFSDEMISEACSRTIKAIHEPSFGYANSILEKWYSQGITSPEMAAEADEAYRQSKKTERDTRSQEGASNRFINFKQRDNNYEDLQKRLLKTSMQ